MRKAILTTTVILLFALSNWGCQVSSSDEDLLDDYVGQIRSAQILVSAHQDQNYDEDTQYHEGMNSHLSRMKTLRTQMIERCEELQDCPEGCGWSGRKSGVCTNGAQMLSVDEMRAIAEQERTVKEELDEFQNHCLVAGTESGCSNLQRENHFEHMKDILNTHYDFCHQMGEDKRAEDVFESPMCHQGGGRMGMH